MTMSPERAMFEEARRSLIKMGDTGREILKHPDVEPYLLLLNTAWVEHRRRWSASSDDALEGALARLAGRIVEVAKRDL